MKYSPQQERELMLDLWSPQIADDVLAFVRYTFPWGEPNTPLEQFKEPRNWQCEDFDEISQAIADNKGRVALDMLPSMYRKAMVSGRGPGKSAFLAMLTIWFESTRIGATTIVTANGEPQLKSRTWPEIGKWATLAINSHWFDFQATSLRPAKWFEEAVKRDLKIDTGYYYAQAQLWREEAPDAFAGAHNPNGMMLLCDEASGIPASIWSVSEGFFTEPSPNRYWFAFSNGRRNSGPFYDCFHNDAARWRKRQLDSRTVNGVDPAVYQGIIDKYGAESDQARVEVYGQFPLDGDLQFISNGTVDAAQRREVMPDNGAPLMLGVDIARHGNDSTVLRFRQGRDARSIPAIKLRGKDNVEVAAAVASAIEKFKPDGVAIDAGNGTGVIDILRHQKYRVHEIWFGSKAASKEWDDKRTEMWADMRDWLGGGAIDSDPELFTDLTAPERLRVGKGDDKIRLESKESLRDRGFRSPDDGDALALTFAVKVSRRDSATSRMGSRSRVARDVDYPLFGG